MNLNLNLVLSEKNMHKFQILIGIIKHKTIFSTQPNLTERMC